MILGASNSEGQTNGHRIFRITERAMSDASLDYERLANVPGLLGWRRANEVVAAAQPMPSSPRPALPGRQRPETIEAVVDSALMSQAAIIDRDFEFLLSIRQWPWPLSPRQANTIERLIRRSRVAGQWSAP